MFRNVQGGQSFFERKKNVHKNEIFTKKRTNRTIIFLPNNVGKKTYKTLQFSEKNPYMFMKNPCN